MAAIWKNPAGGTPITLTTMAQISYDNLRRMAGAGHPRPTGPVQMSSGVLPGVAGDLAALLRDPRPPAREGEVGRGALPIEQGRFEGIELARDTVILRYRSGDTLVRE